MGNELTICKLGNLHAFLSSPDFIQNHLFFYYCRGHPRINCAKSFSNRLGVIFDKMIFKVFPMDTEEKLALPPGSHIFQSIK